jgi:hypothetical protein
VVAATGCNIGSSVNAAIFILRSVFFAMAMARSKLGDDPEFGSFVTSSEFGSL